MTNANTIIEAAIPITNPRFNEFNNRTESRAPKAAPNKSKPYKRAICFLLF